MDAHCNFGTALQTAEMFSLGEFATPEALRTKVTLAAQALFGLSPRTMGSGDCIGDSLELTQAAHHALPIELWAQNAAYTYGGGAMFAFNTDTFPDHHLQRYRMQKAEAEAYLINGINLPDQILEAFSLAVPEAYAFIDSYTPRASVDSLMELISPLPEDAGTRLGHSGIQSTKEQQAAVASDELRRELQQEYSKYFHRFRPFFKLLDLRTILTPGECPVAVAACTMSVIREQICLYDYLMKLVKYWKDQGDPVAQALATSLSEEMLPETVSKLLTAKVIKYKYDFWSSVLGVIPVGQLIFAVVTHNHVPGVSSIMKAMGSLLREFTLIEKDGTQLNFSQVLELKALLAQAERNGDVIDRDRIARLIIDAVYKASRFQFTGFNFNWTEKSTELLTLRMQYISGNQYSTKDFNTILLILDEGYNALQQVARVRRPQLHDEGPGVASSVNTVVVTETSKAAEDVDLSNSLAGSGKGRKNRSTVASVWLANGPDVQAQQLDEMSVQNGGIKAKFKSCPNPVCNNKRVLHHHIFCAECGYWDKATSWACPSPRCDCINSIFTQNGKKPNDRECRLRYVNCKGTIQGARRGSALTDKDKEEVLGYITYYNERMAKEGRRLVPTTYVE
jgi:hypothetical protein